MEVSARTFFVCFMAVETYACGIRLPRQFVAQGFNNENEESSRLEDILDLSRPALHTLLKGLAALLVQLYPDVTPRPPTVPPSGSKKEKDEPIKIFRQIMQIPGPIYPPLTSMYPCHQMLHQQPTQMPQDPCQSPRVPSQDHYLQGIQMPQAPDVQMPQTTQITEHCYPASTCCQQNPFSQDQYNC